MEATERRRDDMDDLAQEARALVIICMVKGVGIETGALIGAGHGEPVDEIFVGQLGDKVIHVGIVRLHSGASAQLLQHATQPCRRHNRIAWVKEERMLHHPSQVSGPRIVAAASGIALGIDHLIASEDDHAATHLAALAREDN